MLLTLTTTESIDIIMPALPARATSLSLDRGVASEHVSTLTETLESTEILSLFVADCSSFPEYGTLQIGTELITYAGKNGTTELTNLTRGVNNTSAISHNQSAAIACLIAWSPNNPILSGLHGLEEVTDTGLLPNTTYFYRSLAVNPTATAISDDYTEGSTLPILPEKPGKVEFDNVGGTHLDILLPEELEDNTTELHLYRGLTEGGMVSIADVTLLLGLGQVYTDENLTEDTLYIYRYVASNTEGYTSGDLAAVKTNLHDEPVGLPAPVARIAAVGEVEVLSPETPDFPDYTVSLTLQVKLATDTNWETAFTGVLADQSVTWDTYLSAPLEQGETYHLRWVGINANTSQEGPVTSLLLDVPLSPQAPILIVTGTTSINVNPAPFPAHTDNLTVIRSVDETDWENITDPALLNDNAFDDTGLLSLKTYFYRAVAHNPYGFSTSVSASETTESVEEETGILPDIATMPVVADIDADSGTVTFSAFPAHTDYLDIRYREVNTVNWVDVPAQLRSDSTPYLLEDLTPLTSYEIKFKAWNKSDGLQFVYGDSRFFTTVTILPEKPGKVVFDDVFATHLIIKIDFEYPERCDNLGLYSIDANGAKTLVLDNITSETTSFELSGLTPATTYKYVFGATNTEGTSYGDEAGVVMDVEEPKSFPLEPDSPTLASIALTGEPIEVVAPEWSDSTVYPVEGMQLWVKYGSGAYNLYGDVTSLEHVYTLPVTYPEHVYLKARAYNTYLGDLQYSGFSEILDIQPSSNIDVVVTIPPGPVSVDDVTSVSLSVVCREIGDAQNVVDLQYRLFTIDDSETWSLWGTSFTVDVPNIITGLNSDTEYELRFRGSRGIYSAYGPSAIVRTRSVGEQGEIPAPPAITNLSCASGGSTSVLATLPSFVGDATTQNLQYTEDPEGTWTTYGSPHTGEDAVTVTGLTPGTTYFFRVIQYGILTAYNGYYASGRTSPGLPSQPDKPTAIYDNGAMTVTLPVGIDDEDFLYLVRRDGGPTFDDAVLLDPAPSNFSGLTEGSVVYDVTVAPDSLYWYSAIAGNLCGETTTDVAHTVKIDTFEALPDIPGKVIFDDVYATHLKILVDFPYPARCRTLGLYSIDSEDVKTLVRVVGETETAFELTELTPNTTYRYVFGALNSRGVVYGDEAGVVMDLTEEKLPPTTPGPPRRIGTTLTDEYLPNGHIFAQEVTIAGPATWSTSLTNPTEGLELWLDTGGGYAKYCDLLEVDQEEEIALPPANLSKFKVKAYNTLNDIRQYSAFSSELIVNLVSSSCVITITDPTSAEQTYYRTNVAFTVVDSAGHSQEQFSVNGLGVINLNSV